MGLVDWEPSELGQVPAIPPQGAVPVSSASVLSQNQDRENFIDPSINGNQLGQRAAHVLMLAQVGSFWLW